MTTCFISMFALDGWVDRGEGGGVGGWMCCWHSLRLGCVSGKALRHSLVTQGAAINIPGTGCSRFGIGVIRG